MPAEGEEPTGPAVRVLNDAMVDKLSNYEASDLAERHKVALRYADAVMTQPAHVGERLTADLRRHFTRDEIVELTIDILKWNMQKVTVALGHDAPIADEPEDLVFDNRGNWVR